MSRTFERFTERARQVVGLAQEEARGLGHNYLGTEHILLGLLREEEGVASRALHGLDIAEDRVRSQVIRIVGKDGASNEGQLPFTPRSKKVLDLSLREALSLGHNYIGTEHILLGLVRENEGVAARILRDDFQVGFETIRNEVIRMLSGPRDRRVRGTVELQDALEAKRGEKEAAIEARRFDQAAKLRDEERVLANELRGRIPEPEEDLLPGLRETGKLIGGGKVQAQIIDGPLITGDVASLTFGGVTDTLVLTDKKVEHKIPLNRLESLTLC